MPKCVIERREKDMTVTHHKTKRLDMNTLNKTVILFSTKRHS